MSGSRMWVSKSGSWPLRQGDPPPWEFFRERRAAQGDERIHVDLGCVSVSFEGLDRAVAEILRSRYGPFASEEAHDSLRVRVCQEEREYFLEPADRPEFTAVFLACDGDSVRYLSYQAAGWFKTGPGGDGLLLVSRGAYEPIVRTFENFTRAAVAWQAATRGGALVHGASAVRDGRGYLFYGESGAGKSTLAQVNRRGTILSDDLSLVFPREGGGAELVGSPFRGTYEEGPPVRGRFPLAAAFRLVKSDRSEVVAAPRVLAFAQLVGNLAFLAEGFERRPDLFEGVEKTFSGVPLAQLRFRKDDTFWDAIREAGL